MSNVLKYVTIFMCIFYCVCFTGIFGHKDCEFIDSWNAFKCNDSVNYAMLIIESMDPDTETRRLSPIAVHSGPYIDLLNGPMDHGWCFGYTCRQRLSTFPAIVPLGEFVCVNTLVENISIFTALLWSQTFVSRIFTKERQ